MEYPAVQACWQETWSGPVVVAILSTFEGTAIRAFKCRPRTGELLKAGRWKDAPRQEKNDEIFCKVLAKADRATVGRLQNLMKSYTWGLPLRFHPGPWYFVHED